MKFAKIILALIFVFGLSACATKPPRKSTDPSDDTIAKAETLQATTAGLIAMMTQKAEDQKTFFEGRLERTRKTRKWMNVGIFVLNSATTATLGFSAPMDASLATSLGATFLNGAVPVLTPGGEPPLLQAYSGSACVAAAGNLMSNPATVREYARISALLTRDIDEDQEQEYRQLLNRYDSFAASMQIKLSNIFNIFYGATAIDIIDAVNTPQTNQQLTRMNDANETVQNMMSAPEILAIPNKANGDNNMGNANQDDPMADEGADNFNSLIDRASFILNGC